MFLPTLLNQGFSAFRPFIFKTTDHSPRLPTQPLRWRGIMERNAVDCRLWSVHFPYAFTCTLASWLHKPMRPSPMR